VARERLRRLVRPLVLRRTKGQVLAGLPEKIEDRRHCEMTAHQATLHAELLSTRGASLRESLDGGGAIPYLHVFALLDKLKQLCDHPDLLLPPGSPPSGETSGKWELFVELLDEALASGLKVVVFSQYLRMLDRIERHLAGLGIGFAGIRGATADRRAPVARFLDDADCRVFVASLKAAGLGIDLTSASVVIHYDRWWNKAREDQATDRVHRIGQKRGVQVLTLVTRDSVEERIDRLIAKKARLAADLVPEEDPRLFRRFTREEMRALLSP
jgi:SNF2 family DNA or RNA helicase